MHPPPKSVGKKDASFLMGISPYSHGKYYKVVNDYEGSVEQRIFICSNLHNMTKQVTTSFIKISCIRSATQNNETE